MADTEPLLVPHKIILEVDYLSATYINNASAVVHAFMQGDMDRVQEVIAAIGNILNKPEGPNSINRFERSFNAQLANIWPSLQWRGEIKPKKR